MIRRFSILCSTLFLLSTSAYAQISVDSIDTFSVDNEGWVVGGAGTAPTQNPGLSFDGEPGFLRHFSDGSGSNGRFIMWSEQLDWTGDYIGAGVTGISLWADGQSGNDVPFWLAFDGPGGWFFTPGQTITTANDWEQFDFDVTADNLIYAAGSGGTGNAVDTLSAVERFEIFAGPGPVEFRDNGDLLRAEQSTNVIWFDNIAAVPEPSSLMLGGLAIGGLIVLRRYR